MNHGQYALASRSDFTVMHEMLDQVTDQNLPDLLCLACGRYQKDCGFDVEHAVRLGKPTAVDILLKHDKDSLQLLHGSYDSTGNTVGNVFQDKASDATHVHATASAASSKLDCETAAAEQRSNKQQAATAAFGFLLSCTRLDLVNLARRLSGTSAAKFMGGFCHNSN